MNKESELIITESFNGLLSRMAGLDHLGILQEGRKILKQAKKLKTEPMMRMSEVLQLTGMTKEDLAFFTSSCRLTGSRCDEEAWNRRRCFAAPTVLEAQLV